MRTPPASAPTALLPLLALTMLGCTTSEHPAVPIATLPLTSVAPSTSDASTIPSPTTSATTAPPDFSHPGTDLAECFDGTCTVAFTGTATLALDMAKLGYSGMALTIKSPEVMQIALSPASAGLDMSIAAGSTAKFKRSDNPTITVQWKSTGDTSGIADLSLSRA
ncbi:hypothetical protein AB0N05_06985 [Nocardia sp. NPDC051030]|uniref:hypothetical protein n=1 Tax=Nocardia sp. NPDC051030 TaxID=3155162 RepID=UPI003426DB97